MKIIKIRSVLKILILITFFLVNIYDIQVIKTLQFNLAKT